MSARVAVVRFPGSNCESETIEAVERAAAEALLLDFRETTLRGADAVILPGGFSYGDYLRSGAIARFAPVMQAVRDHADAGGAVLGICNGFQILCEAHLLPGALVHNAGHRFVARPVDVLIERNDTICTTEFAIGTLVRIPQAHGEGRFVADEAGLDAIEAGDQVVLRYTLRPGSDLPANPNGSCRDIAGVCNPAGNVVGIMPHPERSADPGMADANGHGFFDSMARWLTTGARA